jgi:hypothetical protein
MKNGGHFVDTFVFLDQKKGLKDCRLVSLSYRNRSVFSLVAGIGFEPMTFGL